MFYPLFGAPTGREFGRFVQDAKATMLGVVPSLVRTWRKTACLQGLDWSAVTGFHMDEYIGVAGDQPVSFARYNAISARPTKIS